MAHPWRQPRRSTHPGGHHPRAYRPFLEKLEPRQLLTGAAAGQAAAAYGQLPLRFEANQGQTDARVRFLARGPGYAVFLTPTGAVLSLHEPAGEPTGPGTLPDATTAVLALSLAGARSAPAVVGLDRQLAVSNYFLGNDPSQWRRDVPTYGRVAYPDVYPGIDLVYHGNQRQLEYDFVVAPGADPSVIRFSFGGAQGLSLDDGGNLVVRVAGTEVIEHAPVLYQDGPTGRQLVAGRYVLTNGGQVGFAVGAYDPSRPLTIDPTLAYSTYLGGSGLDEGHAIAVDHAGNAYVTGFTYSSNFPITPGAFQTTNHGQYDVFVTKLNPEGTDLVYSTYLGGSSGDTGQGIALDTAGDAFITGFTYSTDFPTTPGAFQRTKGSSMSVFSVFVAELNPEGTDLVYSSYLGGRNSLYYSKAYGIAVDGGGDAYVTGLTYSPDFPTTLGAFQPTNHGNGDAFVTEFNPTGTALVYSTFLGGAVQMDQGNSIAVDAAGDAYVAGSTYSRDFPTTPGAFNTTFGQLEEAFVTELNPSGSSLVYSTFLGGTTSTNEAYGIAVDGAGNAYVAGTTISFDFPTTPGAFQTTNPGNYQVFMTKLNPSGSGLVYSTYLGGRAPNEATALTLDQAGNASVTGFTYSSDFPTTSDAFQTSDRGLDDAFVTEFNATGTALVYSTYLGGRNHDTGTGLAVDRAGNLYVTGTTYATDFPTTPGAFQTTNGGIDDAFVAKFVRRPTVTGVVAVPVAEGTPFPLATLAPTGAIPDHTAEVNNVGSTSTPARADIDVTPPAASPLPGPDDLGRLTAVGGAALTGDDGLEPLTGESNIQEGR